jgi:hypothetical protein
VAVAEPWAGTVPSGAEAGWTLQPDGAVSVSPVWYSGTSASLVSVAVTATVLPAWTTCGALTATACGP